MTGTEYVVLRRGDASWALPDDCVRTITATAVGIEVVTTAGALLADEIVDITRSLEVHAGGAVLRSLWRERCAGLALYGGVPVVVIDPAAPPRALRVEGGLSHEK